ncbi:hypothetical protein [Caulobacter soli]|uniref:hypothetical protein n=1 Tax=Caulobacter soli TaxID=2708539 RepID=UPI0013EAE1A8|nr:hypothetical protein [Caulobacter soli]
MSIDLSEYRYLVENFGLTGAQQDELLNILSHIALHFVDLGWGTDSTQLCMALAKPGDPLHEADLANWRPESLAGNFKHAADEDVARKDKP